MTPTTTHIDDARDDERACDVTVSVVIPTYNRLGRLRRVLAALAAQDYPVDSLEIVVVSDGSTDGTDQFLTGDDLPIAIVPAFQSNAGPAAARNRGLELASGDVVVFIDDDIVATPTLISEHVRVHRSSSVDTVVIGPMLTPHDHEMSPWIRWEQEMLDKQYDAMRAEKWPATARQFYTGNASAPRRLLLASGGFDTSFHRAEDVELAYRLQADGTPFSMNLSAVGYHYAQRSFRSWRDNAGAYGRANVIFGRDLGHSWLLDATSSEFRDLNVANRWAARLGVRSDLFADLFCRVGRVAVTLFEAVGLRRLSRYALSGIYTVQYHRGIAAELGGPNEFAAYLERDRRDAVEDPASASPDSDRIVDT